MRIAIVLALASLLFSADPASASKKKTKRSDDIEAVETRGPKRSKNDPVLRRYGKKAEYVVVSDYDERKARAKSEANAEDSEPSAKKAKAKPVKSAKKAPKPIADDEVVIIIEDEPPKKSKTADDDE